MRAAPDVSALLNEMSSDLNSGHGPLRMVFGHKGLSVFQRLVFTVLLSAAALSLFPVPCEAGDVAGYGPVPWRKRSPLGTDGQFQRQVAHAGKTRRDRETVRRLWDQELPVGGGGNAARALTTGGDVRHHL